MRAPSCRAIARQMRRTRRRRRGRWTNVNVLHSLTRRRGPSWSSWSLVAVVALVALAAGCGSSSTSSSTSPTPAASGSTPRRAGRRRTSPRVTGRPGAQADAAERASERQQSRVASDIPYPPWEYYDPPTSKNPAGFDYDLSQALGKKIGVPTSFNETPFDSIILSIKGGKNDMIMSDMYDNAEREDAGRQLRRLRLRRHLDARQEGQPERRHHPRQPGRQDGRLRERHDAAGVPAEAEQAVRELGQGGDEDPRAARTSRRRCSPSRAAARSATSPTTRRRRTSPRRPTTATRSRSSPTRARPQGYDPQLVGIGIVAKNTQLIDTVQKALQDADRRGHLPEDHRQVRAASRSSRRRSTRAASRCLRPAPSPVTLSAAWKRLDLDPGMAAAGGPAAAARPEAIKAIPVRHWGRWISAVIVVYLLVALIFSFVKNPNVDWPTVWEYLFKPLTLIGRRAHHRADLRLHGRRRRRRRGTRGHEALGQPGALVDRLGATSGSSAALRCTCRSSCGATSACCGRTFYVGLPFTGLVVGSTSQRPAGQQPDRGRRSWRWG